MYPCILHHSGRYVSDIIFENNYSEKAEIAYEYFRGAYLDRKSREKEPITSIRSFIGPKFGAGRVMYRTVEIIWTENRYHAMKFSTMDEAFDTIWITMAHDIFAHYGENHNRLESLIPGVSPYGITEFNSPDLFHSLKKRWELKTKRLKFARQCLLHVAEQYNREVDRDYARKTSIKWSYEFLKLLREKIYGSKSLKSFIALLSHDRDSISPYDSFTALELEELIREHNNDDGLMELADLIQDEFRDGTFKTRSTCSFYPLNDNSQFVLKMILNDSLTGKVDFLSSKFMMKMTKPYTVT